VIDARDAVAVGRHAQLDLRFERRGERTILTHAYAEPPLRVGRAFEVDDAAYVILVCSGPGIFSGDRLHCRVSVGPGARVVMSSQSSFQIHPAESVDPARIHHEYAVEDEGELLCHWDPLIPFAGSRLVQHVDLRLSPRSRLYWSDGMLSGRVGRGEAWKFESLDHELRLSIGGALPYLERYRLVPSERSLQHRWLAASGDYLGTTIVRHEAAVAEAGESLHRQLELIQHTAAAIDVVDAAHGVIVGRFLGENGPRWHEARAVCRDFVINRIFERPLLQFRR